MNPLIPMMAFLFALLIVLPHHTTYQTINPAPAAHVTGAP